MSQAAFDEEAGKQLEALYRIGDAVRRRCLVRAALGASPDERIPMSAVARGSIAPS